MSASALLAAMLVAMHAQQSAHYVTHTTSGVTKVTIVGDVGKTTGTQQVTFTQSGKSGQVTVRLVNDTAYFRGDAFALQNFMGVPVANATRYAGDWVRVPRTAKQYASIAADVTLPSFAANLAFNGVVSKIKGGIAITTATGGVKLFLTKKHLPTHETGKGSGGTLSMTVGRWNERVRVAAPAKTVPVQDVFRTAPGA
jgi:hypothetical protein